VLIVINNKHVEFYDLMGKFLGKREIYKEVGINLWDDDDKTWIISTDNKVNGFSSFSIKNNTCKFDLIYVLPNFRKIGIGKDIALKAIDFCKDNKVSKIVGIFNDNSKGIHLKLGYEKVGTKGKYDKLEKILEDN
jgi:L-amino acid N-acyltransferase YncA